MLRTWFKNLQMEHQKTKIYANQNFQFHFHYRVMSKNVLIKTQKPQLCCCPNGLLVKLWDYQAMSNACTSLNPTWGNFTFFPDFFLQQTDAKRVCLHVFEMYRLFLNNLRLKLGQNNNVVEVSFRHYSSVYISAVDSISTTNQCSKYHKIRQPMLIIFFFLGCSCLLVKSEKDKI